jgi:hypothetical protein
MTAAAPWRATAPRAGTLAHQIAQFVDIGVRGVDLRLGDLAQRLQQPRSCSIASARERSSDVSGCLRRVSLKRLINASVSAWRKMHRQPMPCCAQIADQRGKSEKVLRLVAGVDAGRGPTHSPGRSGTHRVEPSANSRSRNSGRLSMQ